MNITKCISIDKKISHVPLVLDHSKYKKIYTQIELTYQARSVLEDESFRETYNEILVKNAKIKGEKPPVFDDEL